MQAVPGFGTRLKSAIKRSELDPAAVALRARIDRRTLDRYLDRDEAPNRPTNVEAVAGVLGVNPKWLETGEPDVSVDTSDDEPAVVTRRPHVVLDDSEPPPPGSTSRLVIAEVYDVHGHRVGLRYAVTELHTVPYRVVLHPDGSETLAPSAEPASPEAA